MGSFTGRKGDGTPRWSTLYAGSRSFSCLRRASWSREKDLGKDEREAGRASVFLVKGRMQVTSESSSGPWR